jgi:hypothetical protein
MSTEALTPPPGMWAHPDADPRHDGAPVLRGERAVVLD